VCPVQTTVLYLVSSSPFIASPSVRAVKSNVIPCGRDQIKGNAYTRVLPKGTEDQYL